MNNTKNYYFHINIEIATNMEASSKKIGRAHV